MPVTVERIYSPSKQDFEDLQKIYQDAPKWVIEDTQPSTNESAIKALIHSASKKELRYLYAARFNSRLLAAILVDEQDGSWLLHSLCVRKLTRGRGVGDRLLTSVAQHAKYRGKLIKIEDPEKRLDCDRLKQTLGNYQLVANSQDLSST
ncbi:MAG: acetyl-CoA sensor PanZ family protein [Endozoicomonas sp. (ex Botrylloides leachii)]|nr:acetyl-CoA sensor PanZ family protein [Endozoicomonas sp. (ex Botrylloides leachii)]